jgi:hypothetical protein
MIAQGLVFLALFVGGVVLILGGFVVVGIFTIGAGIAVLAYWVMGV